MSFFWVSMKNHHTDEWWEAIIEADSREHALEKFLRRTSIRDHIISAATKVDGPDHLTFVIHRQAKRKRP